MNKEIQQDLRKWRFWRHFALHGFSALGAVTVVLEFFDVIFPDIVAKGGSNVAASVAVASVLYGAARAWPRPIEQAYETPNTTIRVLKGDLFAQTSHLVIGMSDTFDTEPPHIIARESLQAQFLARVFDGDIAELDAQLERALADQQAVTSIEKTGKTLKYPVGTVATLRQHGRRYFCVAYTEMNERNEARATVGGVWRSLEALWRAVSEHANGEPVAIPVIGGGQARLSQVLPAQDSIRFIILSFMLASRQERLCSELSIVVRPGDYAKLDRLELQAFLTSLVPS